MIDFDLLVITPSRGRPDNLLRLARAMQSTCTSNVGLVVGVDIDDPRIDDYAQMFLPPFDDASRQILSTALVEFGDRHTLTGWTNCLAEQVAHRARYLASLGDDHEPITEGWDVKLMGHIAATTPGHIGIAYGDDGVQGERLPTAVVMSSLIVRQLGWMCCPAVGHFYVDDAWRTLGQRAGFLTYDSSVKITHHHHAVADSAGRGLARYDDTYADAQAGGRQEADRLAYEAWCDGPGLDDAVSELVTLRGSLFIREPI